MSDRICKPWSEEEYQQLWQLVAKHSASEIAKIMGRSRCSILNKCWQKGLRLAGGKSHKHRVRKCLR
jgi:transposase-like protein